MSNTSPSPHHIEHAKRKLIIYLQSLINQSLESTEIESKFETKVESNVIQLLDDDLSFINSHSKKINSLPNEIWESKIINYLNGVGLSSFSNTCSTAYLMTKESMLWIEMVNKKLEKLGLGYLTQNKSGPALIKNGKRMFVKMKPYFKHVEQVMNSLKRVQKVPKEAGVIQNIFRQLNLDSPWSSSPICRFQSDIKKYKYPEEIIIGDVLQKSANFILKPNTGFYRGETLEFIIHACQYPLGPPTVHLLSSTYHPLVRPCGRVDYPLSAESIWKTEKTIVDVLLEVLFLFMAENYLTDYFNL